MPRPPDQVRVTNAKRRTKYAEIPEYRQKKLDRANADYAANREKVKAARRAYYEANCEDLKRKGREYWHIKKAKIREKQYGLTQEKYDAMFAAQEGRCAICFKPDPLVVDHCHATGRVRGLLCNPCNRVLGVFDDSTDRFTAAIKYLERR